MLVVLRGRKQIKSIVIAFNLGDHNATTLNGRELDLFGLVGELMSEITAAKQKTRKEGLKELLGMFADKKEEK